MMSLRARLLIVLGVLVTSYVVVALLIIATQRSLLIGQVDNVLLTIPPPAFSGLSQSALELGESSPRESSDTPAEDSRSPFIDVYIGMVDGRVAVEQLLMGTRVEGTPDIAAAVNRTGGQRGIVTISATDGGDRFRALVIPQQSGDRWMVAAQPLAEIDASIARLRRTLIVAGIVIGGVLAIAAFWISRLGLRPIARVTAAAEAITAGDRGRRLEIRHPGTEAGKLGVAFNVMLDERDAAEVRLRQFVADASHELRTPITSVRGYLELFHQGAFREPTQVDDAVRRLSAEAARMHTLVEDLLSLASLDADRPLQRAQVDLGRVIRDVVQDAGATQPARPITVVVPAHGPEIDGDEMLIIQLLGILVANALTHTPVTAGVTISARQLDSGAEITVADNGPGLEGDAAERVFDRFWRAEQARARGKNAVAGRIGGAGLGLAIAKSIVDAHGGTIALTTAPGAGCTFTVRLPGMVVTAGG